MKESNIGNLTHQYEISKTGSNESIKDMYSRSTNIINDLKSLGKSYPNADLVENLLRSLLIS